MGWLDIKIVVHASSSTPRRRNILANNMATILAKMLLSHFSDCCSCALELLVPSCMLIWP
jgi:hypothetical protein